MKSSMWRLPVLGLAAGAVLITACGQPERPAAPPETPAAATAAAEPAAVPADTAATTPAEGPVVAHDITGGYFPMEKLPAEFSELDHLSLATIDENAAPAPLNGFLRPKKSSAEDYTLVSPVLDGKRLTFTTKAVGGVQYAFTGAFEVLHNFPETPPDYETAVLSGTLTKMRDGKTVAETPVKYRYEAGG
ncbi:MAG TPA: hypothetical protein VEK57_23440 [Thermoanaerobaculia bacterium]|nr:hypothetical protein [Thermoanaerobaculia bacterium]